MAANLESSHREDVLPYHSKSPGLPYDNPSYDDRRWESSAHRRPEDRPTLESRRMTSHGSGGGGGGGNYGAGGGGRGSISSREVVMEMEDIVEPEEERPFIRRDVASPSQPSSASESRRSQWSSDVYWLAYVVVVISSFSRGIGTLPLIVMCPCSLYFAFNLGLTLFNKIVLVSFPFPYVSRLRCIVASRRVLLLGFPRLKAADSDSLPRVSDPYGLTCFEWLHRLLYCPRERVLREAQKTTLLGAKPS
jgi:hypothetical protein